LLRSGTSTGVNIKESIGGQSRADFLHKVSIAYKEARETIYWIQLLTATEYFTKGEAKNLLTDVEKRFAGSPVKSKFQSNNTVIHNNP
jgi:four helix bundle protein